ncbi:MAG: metallophosphoesterase family protein [Geminicoccaceae bacterium]|nr:metallophosphoesterase family protein [Geminicoccaceae bacterium]
MHQAVTAADTLIVSDIHLGLPASRPRELLEFFESRCSRRIILLGDVFNDLHFRHLCRDAFRLLDYWRLMARRGFCELVWIKGNHDRDFEHAVRPLLGTSGFEDYCWESGERRFLALHGDRFDPSCTRFRSLPILLSDLNSWAQRRCGMDHSWSERFDIIHERFGRLAHRMPFAAAELARKLDCEAVICGHTHRTHRRSVPDERGMVEYLNAGAWIGRPGHFVTVTDGVATLAAHP